MRVYPLPFSLLSFFLLHFAIILLPLLSPSFLAWTIFSCNFVLILFTCDGILPIDFGCTSYPSVLGKRGGWIPTSFSSAFQGKRGGNHQHIILTADEYNVWRHTTLTSIIHVLYHHHAIALRCDVCSILYLPIARSAYSHMQNILPTWKALMHTSKKLAGLPFHFISSPNFFSHLLFSSLLSVLIFICIIFYSFPFYYAIVSSSLSCHHIVSYYIPYLCTCALYIFHLRNMKIQNQKYPKI